MRSAQFTTSPDLTPNSLARSSLTMLALFLYVVLFLCRPFKSETLFEDDLRQVEKFASISPQFSGLLNEYDEQGMTRLMLAAKTGQLELLKDFIAGGADIHLETADKNTALLLAVRGGFYYTSIELVRAKSHLNHRNSNGMTPLLLAIVGGHNDIAIGIIDGGADTNISNNDGSSALVMAAQSGSKAVVECLVRNGAIVDSVSGGGDTALMFASATGHADIVQYLLSKGARAAITNKREYTALMFAAIRGHGKVIEAIVEHDRSTLHAKDKMGRAALDHAIASNRQGAVDALVTLGADLPRSGFRVSAEVMAKRAEYLKHLNRPAEAARRSGRDGAL